jgi:hypothetical protein
MSSEAEVALDWVELLDCPPANVYVVERDSTGSLREHPAVEAAFADGAERVIVRPPGITDQQFDEVKDALPKPRADHLPD